MTHHPHQRPHDRAGWWDIARRHPLGRLPPKLSLAGKGPVPTVPPLDVSDAARRTRDRPFAVLRRPRPTRLQSRVQGLSRAAAYRTKWFVYSKRPFAGPEQVLAYLSRYTHRVAISSSRLIAANATGVTFSYKDYRIEGPGRYKSMTRNPGELIRRVLIHVLPHGFHRIRHCGLLASGTKAETIARALN